MAASATIGLLRVLLTADTGAFTAAMKASSASAQAWSKDLKSIGQQASTVGKSLSTSITLPLVGIGAMVLKVGQEFEKSLNAINGVLQPTGEQMDRIRATAIKMGADTAFSANDAATAMLELGKAGFSTDTAIASVGRVLELAAASGLSMGDSAALAARALNAFGLEAGDLQHVNDVLAKAVNKSSLEIGDMQVAFGYIAPIARGFGLSLEEVSAALAIMRDNGIAAETSGRALREGFSRLANPVKAVEEVMAQLGIQSFETNGKMMGLAEIVGLLQSKGLTAAQSLKLFGDAAGPGMFALVSKGAPALRELTSELQNSDGAAKAMADSMMKGLPGAMEHLRGSVDTAFLSISKAIEPAVISIAKILGSAADLVTNIVVPAFTALPAPIQTVALGIAGVAAAAPLAIYGFGQMALGMSGLAAAFKEGAIGAKVLEVAMASTGRTMALVTGPIGLIAVGIGGLAIAWGKFKDDWTRSFDVIIPGLGGFRDALASVQSAMEEHKSLLADMATVVSGELAQAWTLFKGDMGDILSAVLKPHMEAWQTFKGILGSVADMVSGKVVPSFREAVASLPGIGAGIALLEVAYNEMSTSSDELRKKLAESARGFRDQADGTKALSASAAAATNALTPLTSGLGFLGKEHELLKLQVQQTTTVIGNVFTASLAHARKEVEALTSAERKEIAAALDQNVSTEKIAEALGKSKEAIELYKDQLAESTKQTEEATKATDKWNESISRSIARWAPFKAAVQDAGQEIRNLRQGLDRDGHLITQSIRETADASGEAAQELKAWADAHGAYLAPAMRGFSGSLNESKGEIQDWRGALNESLMGIPATLARAFEGGGNIGGAFASIGVQLSSTVASSIMNGIEMAAPQMRRLNATISAGSAGAAAVGNAFGGQTAATIGSIAGSIGGAVLATTALGTAAATSATAAVALGAATAGIGLAAVGVFLLAKHFLTVSKAVKEARADLVKFEDAIIDSLTAQQKAEAGGERWAQVLIGVRDTFLQTGRTAQEAERLVAQMFDTNHPERSREAIALVGQAYAELAEQQRIVAEGTEEANGILQDLEAQAALMGNTMPDSLRPMIDRLVEMGVVSDDTAARLGMIGNEGEVSLDAMKKAADEFGIELDTLGPTFKQQQLTEESQRILRGINLLTAGGTDANVVLDGMQDELQAVVDQSRKFGTEIPENMRPYLQSLVDSSELVDENGNKLTDLSSLKFGPPIADQWQIITDKLSLLIDKITAALPKALDEFALKTDQATQDASQNFGTVIGKVNALGTAIRMLPEMPSGDMPDVPTYTPVENYARGSGGILDFGSGRLAMLHGREGVYTEGQIAAMDGNGRPDSGMMDAIREQTRELQKSIRSMLNESRYIAKLGTRDAAMGAV
jgi:TP901 family phage tail tape measure protein